MTDTNPTFKRGKSTDWERQIKEKEMDLASGILGKFFGNGATASTNIAGLVCILGLAFSCLYSTLSTNQSSLEIWKYTAPIVMGGLGYLFGKSGK